MATALFAWLFFAGETATALDPPVGWVYNFLRAPVKQKGKKWEQFDFDKCI